MTRLLVLGLLKKYGPMSGYDIQIGLEQAQIEIWLEVQPASIYYAIKKLIKDEYIKVDRVEQTGKRSRTIYSITELGEINYQKELLSALAESTISFPSDLYGAASFIYDIPAEEAIEALNQQLFKIKALLKVVKRGEVEKNDPHTSVSEIIFQNIYDLCHLQKKCIEDIISNLSTSY